MGWWSRGPPAPSVEELSAIERRCKSLRLALEACARANPADATACGNLEITTLSCYGEVLMKEETGVHRRCLNSLMRGVAFAGGAGGELSCAKYEDALRAGLRARGLFPFAPSR
jgi:hypothetical protein